MYMAKLQVLILLGLIVFDIYKSVLQYQHNIFEW